MASGVRLRWGGRATQAAGVSERPQGPGTWPAGPPLPLLPTVAWREASPAVAATQGSQPEAVAIPTPPHTAPSSGTAPLSGLGLLMCTVTAIPPPRPRGGWGCARVPPALAVVSHLTKDPRAPPVWALQAVGRLWAWQDLRLWFRPWGQVPLLGTQNLMEEDSQEAQEFSGAGPGLGAEASSTRGTPGSRAVWASACRGP